MQETSTLGEEWLSSLPPVEPITPAGNLLVVLIDGASPDLWIEIADALDRLPASPGSLHRQWARLEAAPETVDSLIRLFALDGDPVEAFASRDVIYYNLSGDEEHGLINHVQSLPPGKPAVVRLSILDRGIHSGELSLGDMPAVLRKLVEHDIKGLCTFCAGQGRDLILTTDHGLSLEGGRLFHGKGGVYERAIFRAVWHNR
jgi:hypothetical protein